MSKHTPGPWRIVKDNDADSASGWPVAKFREVCIFSRSCPASEVGAELADANLIAAAPEMFEMLVYLHNEGGV